MFFFAVGDRSYGEMAPVSPHGLQQSESAHDVGLDEITGAMDGAVHMTFGSKVDHSAGLVLGQQTADQGGITDVALHQLVTRIALQGGQSFGVAGIGELVQVDDGFVTGRQPVEHEVGANKTSAAGHKKCHFIKVKNLIGI